MNHSLFAKLMPIWTLTLVTMSGCALMQPAKEDPTRHYVLEGSPLGKLSNRSGPAVLVGPVTIPGYLEHKEIVTAGPSNDLKLADYHIWAEPMDKAISRVLAENLSRLLNSPAVAPFPDVNADFDYKTGIVVRRFEMAADGKVHFKVSYTIDGPAGSKVKSTSRARDVVVSVKRVDDYASIANAMSKALAELSQELAKDLLKSSGAR